MKNFILFSSLLFTLIFTSCENDFTVNAEWKDITVVYGLLDPAEDTNWIRVQRAYLGSDPASASFENPDSLYYDTVAVYLEAYENNNGTAGKLLDSIWLTKDETSKQLEEGTYTTEGFRLYRTLEKINPDNLYKLVVKKPGTNHPDASSTTLVVGMPDDNTAGTIPEEEFRYVQPNRNSRTFDGRLEWRAAENASIYEVDVYLRYKEINRSTGVVTHLVQKMDYGIVDGVQAEVAAGTSIDLNNNPNYLYDKMAVSLPPLEANTLRFVKDFVFVVWAGGDDLAKYISLNKPTQGVNSTKPEFPDIENGAGLFSSRTKTVMDGVVFTTILESQFYISQRLCDYGFAIVTTGDTCYCNRVEGKDIEKVCF